MEGLVVTDVRGRRKHLSPEQYANARKLALAGLGAGLSVRYVLICPSGHLDIPDRVEFVDKED